MEDNKTIVIVEDDNSLSQALTIALERESMKCSVVANGDKALQEVVETRPDCILLDVMLPEATGDFILEQIRNNEEVQDTPVVIITNFDSVEDLKNQAASDPLLHYVVKANTELSEIVDLVKKITGTS